ncbi:GNAT family N-acetyltransferase [Brevibacillus massiliensis]|uniref:GNAT family N-acetyltransferase n=1 Tax=Brevibacillus massiliensis TaxID=1118054 RepID=UPI0002E1C908|nr:GNAT family protein [Brevibacillus massiliensis]
MDLFRLRINGSKVSLRLLSAGDAPAFLDYLIRNKTAHQPFMPLREADYFTLETAARVTDQRRLVEADQQYMFGVFSRETGQLIGKANLSKIIRAAFQNAFLGYDIDHTVQNRGYMTEAIRMVTAFGLNALDLHRIQASIMPRNLASQRVVENAGYIREGYSENYVKINGVWEDHFIYAITCERYHRLPPSLKYAGSIEGAMTAT